MASSSDRDGELARVSSPELVERLRADFDAAARVLAARDRRLAEALAATDGLQAALDAAFADNRALRKELLEVRRRQPPPQDPAGVIAGSGAGADRFGAGVDLPLLHRRRGESYSYPLTLQL